MTHKKIEKLENFRASTDGALEKTIRKLNELIDRENERCGEKCTGDHTVANGLAPLVMCKCGKYLIDPTETKSKPSKECDHECTNQ